MKLEQQKLQAGRKNYGLTAVSLLIKGFFMGMADVIPGVSGGTIALIVGIYEELIDSISNYDAKLLTLLFAGKWKELLKRMNLGFLIPLVLGIALAIFSLARAMSYLLTYHESKTFAVFFGLILGSVVLMSKDLKKTLPNIGFLVIGAALLYWLVGLLPKETPATLLAYFLSAVVAICAMILPGISGSFILVLLGKYHQIMEVIKAPFAEGHLLIILVFAAGAGIGIVGFSKFLKWALARYHDAIFAFLIGMMLGSLRKLWPFAGVELISVDMAAHIGLCLVGLGIILLIHKVEACRAGKSCPFRKQ